MDKITQLIGLVEQYEEFFLINENPFLCYFIKNAEKGPNDLYKLIL